MAQNETALYNIECHGFQNELVPNGGIRIDWDGTAGFGIFDIVFDKDGKAHLHTECMCSDGDKLFAYKIVKRMIDEAIVED